MYIFGLICGQDEEDRIFQSNLQVIEYDSVILFGIGIKWIGQDKKKLTFLPLYPNYLNSHLTIWSLLFESPNYKKIKLGIITLGKIFISNAIKNLAFYFELKLKINK